MTRRTRRHANKAGLVAAEVDQHQPAQQGDVHFEVSLGSGIAPTPQSRHMRDVSGLGIRSAAHREIGCFDFYDEIAGEARLNAQGALDPLPGLGDDIFVEPLARRLVQRPDQKDRALIGDLEVAHGMRSVGAGCSGASTPAGARPTGLR